MTANINVDELQLLAFFHENAEGYTKDFRFEFNDVAGQLGITEKAFKKASSYLAGHGLVGIYTGEDIIARSDRPSFADIFDTRCFHVWLTSLGENYMRSLEAEPSLPSKITASVVRASWNILESAATKLLAEIAVRMISRPSS